MNKEFTKSDLKTGMMVECKNGEEYILLNVFGEDTLYSKCLDRRICFNFYNNYLEYRTCSDYDIIKVYKPNIKRSFFEGRELIWQRTKRTYQTDFLEKHPNAPRLKNGIPKVCARFCGYVANCNHSCPREYDCMGCWTTVMEE